MRGDPAPTLLSLLDTCATSMGARWLRHCLHHPLTDRAVARARHEAVNELLRGHDALSRALSGLADIERIASRIALRNARPRDLSALRESIRRLPEIGSQVGAGDTAISSLLRTLAAALTAPPACLSVLDQAIALEPSALVRDGKVIAPGYSQDLDELRAIQDNCGAFLLELEARERAPPTA